MAHEGSAHVVRMLRAPWCCGMRDARCDMDLDKVATDRLGEVRRDLDLEVATDGSEECGAILDGQAQILS